MSILEKDINKKHNLKQKKIIVLNDLYLEKTHHIQNKKNNKSKKPYILFIKKFKNNENLYIKNSNINNKLKNSLKKSPLSGSELEYNPDLWNKDSTIRESHNCYSYALGKIIKKLRSKAQPGYASGYNYIKNTDYDCTKFRDRLKKDSPGSYLELFNKPCLPGFYKIFLALDPTNDYHWWKQDSNGFWSHKPGSTEVTNLDASGKKIINPLLSNRKFTHRDYYKPCFFSCIYSDLTRSLNSIY